MNDCRSRFSEFYRGVITGMLTTLILGPVAVYLLNMNHVVNVSVAGFPAVHEALAWAHENLKDSVIYFGLAFGLYLFSLVRLRRLLGGARTPTDKIAQADHMVDIWINVFFGIGVIFTAIGMRSALLGGLGNLDADAAAREGAFAILRRLVDGGILLALSTTIFGAVGGYVMRVVKAVYVGPALQRHFERLNSRQADNVTPLLAKMERHLARLAVRRGAGLWDPEGRPGGAVAEGESERGAA